MCRTRVWVPAVVGINCYRTHTHSIHWWRVKTRPRVLHWKQRTNKSSQWRPKCMETLSSWVCCFFCVSSLSAPTLPDPCTAIITEHTHCAPKMMCRTSRRHRHHCVCAHLITRLNQHRVRGARESHTKQPPLAPRTPRTRRDLTGELYLHSVHRTRVRPCRRAIGLNWANGRTHCDTVSVWVLSSAQKRPSHFSAYAKCVRRANTRKNSASKWLFETESGASKWHVFD